MKKMKRDDKIQTIIETVSDYYGISSNEVFEKTRKQEIVKVRHIILYFLRYELGFTFRSISECLHKEISTVVRNFQTIQDNISYDQILKQEMKDLKNLIS